MSSILLDVILDIDCLSSSRETSRLILVIKGLVNWTECEDLIFCVLLKPVLPGAFSCDEVCERVSAGEKIFFKVSLLTWSRWLLLS